jgi:Bifunctional DNA primase/polymerase, N-terminal
MGLLLAALRSSPYLNAKRRHMKPQKTVLGYARIYTERGWRVVPIPNGEKAPVIPNWQKLRINKPDLPDFFGKRNNIGLLLGKPSNGLIDVDLDRKEAILLAGSFLPTTNRKHGRRSKPSSHGWYYVDPSPKPEKFSDIDGKCLLEIRSTGQQTVVPPSLHPEGEQMRWESKGEAALVTKHRFRDTFAVEVLLAGVPIERASVLLGHQSVRVTERHYSPWVHARQEQLENDLKRVCEEDPGALMETKGTPQVHGKTGSYN